MPYRMMLGLLLSFALLALTSPRVDAGQNCGTWGNKTLTITNPIVFSGRYDPTSGAALVVPGTIQLTAPSGLGPCVAWVTLSPGQTGGMSGPGGAHLAYGFTDAFATAAQSVLNIYDDSNGYSPPATGNLVIAAGQQVPAGTYSETRIINVSSASTLLSQQSVVISATVASSCTLPAPATSHLDFSAGVAAAHVVPGYGLGTTIFGASCTGPSVLRLKGAAMTNSVSGGGFSTRINYKATATFGGVTTTLQTATSADVFSPVAAASGAVGINVSLVDEGKALAAGNYSGQLSVVLEPAN